MARADISRTFLSAFPLPDYAYDVGMKLSELQLIVVIVLTRLLQVLMV